MTVAATSARSTVRLGSLAWALGEIVPIESILDDAAPADLLDRLVKNGFRTCSVADEPPTKLGARSVAATLARAGIDAAQVDAVIYSTVSFGRDETEAPLPEPRRRWRVRDAVIDHILKPNGLLHCRLFGGIWLAGSGNLASIWRLARSLILVQGYRTVLCVTADAVPRGRTQFRAMRDGIAVVGDGAASCIVSSAGPGPYVLEGLGQAVSPRISGLGARHALQKRVEIMFGIRTAAKRLYEATDTDAHAYRWLITNNYAEATRNEFAQITGIGTERAYDGSVARVGHALAADPLINLAELDATSPLDPGERVLLLATGPLTWGAAAVRMTASDCSTEPARL